MHLRGLGSGYLITLDPDGAILDSHLGDGYPKTPEFERGSGFECCGALIVKAYELMPYSAILTESDNADIF